MDELWAREEMAGAQVKDARRVTSLVSICARLLAKDGKSYSAALGKAHRQAATRIFSRARLTHMDLLAGHRQQTVARCQAQPLVLAVQDTVVLDYQTHRAKLDLGPTNDGAGGWGLFAHHVQALTEDGLPLGSLAIDFWRRDPEDRGKKKRRQQTPLAEKESAKWCRAHAAVEAALPADVPVLLMGDRENDFYEFLARERRPGCHFLVRVHHPRQVAPLEILTTSGGAPPAPTAPPADRSPGAATAAKGETRSGASAEASRGEEWEVDGTVCVLPAAVPPLTGTGPSVKHPDRQPLAAAVAAAPCVARLQVGVAAKGGAAARDATVEVRACRVRVHRPSTVRVADAPATQEVWVLLAHEPAPPEGVIPVQWLLVTTWPVDTPATAVRLVQAYSRRWGIERLHYTLKSGLGVEKLQIDDRESLQNALAVHWVVAWRLLYVTHVARQEPEAPPERVLTATEHEVLTRVIRKPITTVRAAVRAIAKLGGWEGYPSAGEPGVKVLWRGLRDLEAMVIGWELAKQSALSN